MTNLTKQEPALQQGGVGWACTLKVLLEGPAILQGSNALENVYNLKTQISIKLATVIPNGGYF